MMKQPTKSERRIQGLFERRHLYAWDEWDCAIDYEYRPRELRHRWIREEIAKVRARRAAKGRR